MIDSITLDYKGVEFYVEYDYKPSESADISVDAMYPGCPAMIEDITKFEHKDTCFLEFVDDYFDDIVDLIFESRNL